MMINTSCSGGYLTFITFLFWYFLPVKKLFFWGTWPIQTITDRIHPLITIYIFLSPLFVLYLFQMEHARAAYIRAIALAEAKNEATLPLEMDLASILQAQVKHLRKYYF